MLIKIGNTDLSDIVSYEVTHKDITKEVKNTLGDTFIYVLGEKVTIKIGLGDLTQSKMAVLNNALNNVTVNITYTDIDGSTKTGTFKRSDRSNPIRSFIDSKATWAESEIILTEL